MRFSVSYEKQEVKIEEQINIWYNYFIDKFDLGYDESDDKIHNKIKNIITLPRCFIHSFPFLKLNTDFFSVFSDTFKQIFAVNAVFIFSMYTSFLRMT